MGTPADNPPDLSIPDAPMEAAALQVSDREQAAAHRGPRLALTAALALEAANAAVNAPTPPEVEAVIAAADPREVREIRKTIRTAGRRPAAETKE